MNKILKAKLIKHPFSSEYAVFNPQIVGNKNVGLKDIVEELLKENKELNAQMVFEIICAFNQKVIELVATGNQVNTGLVNLQPTIKGLLINRNWNPTVNRLEVIICQGIDLGITLIDTNIALLDEQGIELEVVNQAQKIKEMKLSAKRDIYADNSASKLNTEPPCGMAFRRWLCNS